jgi:acyl carrier protein
VDVRDTIHGFIRDEVGLSDDDMRDDIPLLGGLVDSLELMKLISFIEEEFDIALSDDDITIEHFRTIGTVERLVRSRLGEPGAG